MNKVVLVALGAVLGAAVGLLLCAGLYTAAVWTREPVGVTPEDIAYYREALVMTASLFVPAGAFGGGSLLGSLNREVSA